MNNQSINQSSIEGVATNTVQTKAKTDMVSHSHRPLFYISRTTAQNSIGFVSACRTNPPQDDRAQKNFRLATVWDKGVCFNTDSSWSVRPLYT